MKHSPIQPEFSPQSAIWLVWPHNQDNWGLSLPKLREFYLELIDLILDHQPVHLILPPNDSSFPHGTHLHKDFNIETFEAPTNTLWIRDYGPWFFQMGLESEIQLFNFSFNSWGEKFPPYDLDAKLPQVLAKQLQLPHFSSSHVFEGGALELNGQGLGITTKECVYNSNRNEAGAQKELHNELMSIFGLDQLIVLDHGLKGDHTDGHIDNMARFISPDKLVIVDTEDTSNPNYNSLKANIASIERQAPELELVRIPALHPRTSGQETLPLSYANFIFLNGAIIVPDYNEPGLEECRSILQLHFPDFKILSINCELLIQEGGALHCMSLQQTVF